jgi:hypothetical protein
MSTELFFSTGEIEVVEPEFALTTSVVVTIILKHEKTLELEKKTYHKTYSELSGLAYGI